MSNDKVKIYKNPARKIEDSDAVRQTYIPQYQILGVTPKDSEERTLPSNVLIARGGSSDNDNPRTRKLSVRQPYVETVILNNESSVTGTIPNVGNNMEQGWSYIDNEMVDDISGQVIGKLDDSHPMIDNNDYVEMPGLPLREEIPQDEQKQFMTVQELTEVIDDSCMFSKIQDDSYILFVSGTIIAVDTMEKIQSIASSLIFGEHPLCDGQAIPIEDIVVLKKIKLKVGLFLE